MKLICILFFITSITINAANKNDVIATVNGKKITFGEFDKSYKENLLFVGSKVVTKEKVLNDLINRELGIIKAKKKNLNNDPVVKKKMEDIMYHAQISKDLEPQLKEITVSDREVEKYYKENPEYRTAHILFRMRAVPSKPEKEEALKQALKVYDTLKKSPEKFAELANRYSQSTAAPSGGDVGFQPAIKYAPEYFQAIKGKEAGFISSPVRSQFGYHIIKVLAVKDYKSINKAFYKKIIYDQKRDQIMANYFKKLRDSAKISVNKNLLK